LQAIRIFDVNKVKLSSSPSLTFDGAEDEAITNWHISEMSDHIISEEPLEIWLKHASTDLQSSSTELLMTTMRSPDDDLNLVRGWLHTSGIVSDSSSIQTITHTGSDRLKHNDTNQVLITMKPNVKLDIRQYNRLEYASSSCGVCGQQSIETFLEKLPSGLAQFEGKLPVSAIYSLAQSLRNKQYVFAQTGGNHGAGLFEIANEANPEMRTELIDVREDVGRHNALDKLIGANLDKLVERAETGSTSYGAVLSGRVSFDLVQKAAMANIKLIIAMGAPSSLAIELARECDICIVGFVKQGSFNIYTRPECIDIHGTSEQCFAKYRDDNEFLGDIK
jgi:FdhD protein